METLRKFEYGLKKTNKIMIVRIGKGEVEQIQERVQQGTVLETDKYKYLGMVIYVTEGNLKDHIATRDVVKIKSNIISYR